MAKRNKVFIDVMVNGKMEKVSVDAAKLGKRLDNVGSSAHTADRRLKGAAQASSGASKNFSKMSQGMGGLVGIYASFAAQVFALSAAFGFLKRAADLENLRKAQIDFASSSGLAIRTLTKNLQDSSQGMMDFKMAAQAAATGAAKGFSGAQLEELVVGATKASKGLGLEFEDTFNRLLRGVSKAEPELLDELGITLRLEEATERYANAIGKSRDALTTAERSQAVFVETMRQLNDTFGAIDPEANPFVQLQKTFQKIVEDITQKAMPAVTGLVNIINNNAQVAAGAFAALAVLILANIAGFGGAIKLMVGGVAGAVAKMGKLAVGGTKMATGGMASKIGSFIKNKAEDLELAALFLEEKLQDVTTKLEKSAGAAIEGGAKSKTLQKLAAGELVSPQALGRLKKDLERVREELVETGETASKAFGGLTVEAIDDINKEINKFEDNLDGSEKELSGFRKAALFALKGVEKGANKTAGAVRRIGEFAEASKKHMGKLKTAFKIGGFAITGLIAISKLLAELAESPIKAIDGFKAMISGVVTVLQKGLNLIVEGLNRLLDNSIVETALNKMGYDTSEGIFGKFTFADNIDSALDDLEERTLAAFGTNRDELQIIQDITDQINKSVTEEQNRLNIVKDLRDEYKALAQDFRDIFAGKAGQGNVAATMQALGSGNLGAARDKLPELRQQQQTLAFNYNRTLQDLLGKGQHERATDYMNMMRPVFEAINDAITESEQFFQQIINDPNFESLPEKFRKAFIDGEDVSGFGVAGRAYTAGLGNLKGMSGNLKNQIGTGDPLKLRIGLQEIINQVTNLDNLMEQVGYTSEEIKNAAHHGIIPSILGENYQQLPTLLKEIEEKFDAINFARTRLAMQAASDEARLPNLLKRQTGLERKAEEANLLLEEKQAKLAQKNLLVLTGGVIDQEVHDQEVRNLQLEIALLERKAAVAEDNMDIIQQASDRVTQGFEDGFVSAFDSIIQGTHSVKDAFLSMGQSILRILARLIAEMIAVKIMQTIIGMSPTSAANTKAAINFGSNPSGLGTKATNISTPMFGDPGRYGGVFSNGGKVPGYAMGGIAKGPQAGYPAVLHGTEAVVPLPNNKSIPVDLRGTGQQNNVTVNVSVDSQGNAQQDAQASNNDAGKLGTMIAGAVQKELQNQKRAGGILSPMGVS